MKVIHLISGGDSGGAKTHVHSLLQNLSRTIDVTMVCFMEGPFAQEARELGIPTQVLPGRNLLHTYRTAPFPGLPTAPSTPAPCGGWTTVSAYPTP